MNLLRAASTVSLLTLVSRITGLAREAIVAATFGAGAWMDAYQVAFRIPNLLRRLFAEGAFSQAFVPILADTRARVDKAGSSLRYGKDQPSGEGATNVSEPIHGVVFQFTEAARA